MELAGKQVTFDAQLTDSQLEDLKTNYAHLWQTLKKLEYKTATQTLEVLYQEPDNTSNYEAGFFTLQIRHQNDTYHFDEYGITVNNKSTFTDSSDEVVIEMAKYQTWDALETDAFAKAEKWIAKMKR